MTRILKPCLIGSALAALTLVANSSNAGSLNIHTSMPTVKFSSSTIVHAPNSSSLNVSKMFNSGNGSGASDRLKNSDGNRNYGSGASDRLKNSNGNRNYGSGASDRLRVIHMNKTIDSSSPNLY